MGIWNKAMIYLSDHQTIASQCAIPNAQSNLIESDIYSYDFSHHKCLTHRALYCNLLNRLTHIPRLVATANHEEITRSKEAARQLLHFRRTRGRSIFSVNLTSGLPLCRAIKLFCKSTRLYAASCSKSSRLFL